MKILFAISILLSGFVPKAESSQTSRPNILFIIADDWSFPHAGIYGDKVARTPTFDRIGTEGAVFFNAFTAAPSCSPARAAVLTGKYPHQLESGGNLWSEWPAEFPTYVDLAEKNGYFVGSTRKGWGPGDFQVSGLSDNPAGKNFEDFDAFLTERPEDKPFVFWFGSQDPHRDYEANTGIKAGMRLEDVDVPGFLPDLACVRNDILDYYFEVERFDRECGHLIATLERIGELDNTVVVITSDNGMPFPRSKANLYDFGVKVPLAIRWPTKILAGTKIESFVNLIDLAPSFLEAMGIPIPNMSGDSLWPLFAATQPGNAEVFLERERHANVRKGNLSYPVRAVRTDRYLYIRNMMPDRLPSGDPHVHQSVGQYGDVDNSITKFLIMQMQGKQNNGLDFFELSFGLRPEEELYDVVKDPYQLNNLAYSKKYSPVKEELREKLINWMRETGDRRFSDPKSTYWDDLRYTPDYQMKDVDVRSEIEKYRIEPPLGKYSKTGIPCITLSSDDKQ